MMPFLNQQIMRAAAEQAVPATTWDPAYKAANITLSNGNLTATGNSTVDSLVRATTGRSTGKFGYEYTHASSGSTAVGFAKYNVPTGSYPGADSDSISYFNKFGYIYGGNTSGISGLPTATAGDIITCVVDIDAGIYWFAKNGAWIDGGNPATGTGGYSGPTGLMYPAADPFSDGVIARFSGTFTRPLPSGFSPWG